MDHWIIHARLQKQFATNKSSLSSPHIVVIGVVWVCCEMISLLSLANTQRAVMMMTRKNYQRVGEQIIVVSSSHSHSLPTFLWQQQWFGFISYPSTHDTTLFSLSPGVSVACGKAKKTRPCASLSHFCVINFGPTSEGGELSELS